VNCAWNAAGKTPCISPAVTTIVYGCLDQHLTEYSYCYTHSLYMLGYLEQGIIACQQITPTSADQTGFGVYTCKNLIVEWDYVNI
jgi:hypothetical protein